MAERRRFGTQGWNRSYPFNNGDLTVSVNVLQNYLEANPKVRENKVTAPQHSTCCNNWPFLEQFAAQMPSREEAQGQERFLPCSLHTQAREGDEYSAS